MVASDFTSRRHVLGRLAGLSLLAMPLAACAAAEAPVVTVRTPSPDAGPELAALETRAGGAVGRLHPDVVDWPDHRMAGG